MLKTYLVMPDEAGASFGRARLVGLADVENMPSGHRLATNEECSSLILFLLNRLKIADDVNRDVAGQRLMR